MARFMERLLSGNQILPLADNTARSSPLSSCQTSGQVTSGEEPCACGTRKATQNALDAPLAVQEMVFAVWLIVKGFDTGASWSVAELDRLPRARADASAE